MVEITSLPNLAPWREKFPNPRILEVVDILAARYDQQVGVGYSVAKFARKSHDIAQRRPGAMLGIGFSVEGRTVEVEQILGQPA